MTIFEVYIVGDGPGTRASIQYEFNTKRTFIYLHNSSGSNWNGIYSAIRNISEGKPFTMPTRYIVHPIDPQLYQKYTSSYLSPAFGLLHVTAEDNTLYLRPDLIPGKEPLIPSSDTTFYFADQALEWEFFLDENGDVIGLGMKGQRERMGVKQR